MELRQLAAYERWGLGKEAVDALARLGDELLSATSNVSGIRDPEAIETHHFLDSLSLLQVREVREAEAIVDVGSGGGLPGLVLALALPAARIVTVDSVGKKCTFMEQAAASLGLGNVAVECARAEELGRGPLRESFPVAVVRAVAALPVLVEYTLPLLRKGGALVAMKGAISDQERIQSESAAAILGGGAVEALKVTPFPEAVNRWLYLIRKVGRTPNAYPRKPGMALKRPLGTEPGGGARG